MDFPLAPLDVTVEAFILGSWVDLGTFADQLDATARLAELGSITRGRSDEDSAVNPASMSLRLWDDDGFLTPRDPASPYWSQDGSGWGQNTPIRVKVGSSVRACTEIAEIVSDWPEGDLSEDGFEPFTVDGEPVTVDGEPVGIVIPDADPGVAFVDVTTAGVMRRIGAGRRALRSPLYRLATKSTNLPHISDYWPMEDGSDSGLIASGLLASSTPTPFTMAFTGDLKLSSDATLAGSESLPNVSANGVANWAAPVRGMSSYSAGLSVEMFFRIPGAPGPEGGLTRLIDLYMTGTISRWLLEVVWDQTAPALRLQVFDDTGEMTDERYSPNPNMFGENWHQLRMDLEPSGGDVIIRYSGYEVTDGDDTASGFLYEDVFTGTMGLPTQIRGAVAYAPPGGVSIGHYVIHDGILGGWLVPADTGWQGELALARMRRLCREEGIPFTYQQSAVSDSTRMGRQRSGQLVDLLAECADADAGILCEQRDGVGLHYRTRRSLYNASPVLTLDAAESEIANPFSPTNDDQQTRNSVTVTRIEGSNVTLIDEVSAAPPPEGHGVYEQSYSLSLETDMMIRHHAGWRLHLGTFEGTRYSQLTVDLGIATSLIPAFKNLDVGDRIRVVNLPPQHPRFPNDYIELIVQGWSETLEPFGWVVTLNCSPAALYDVATWEEFRWAPRSSTLTSGVDADDTSLSVTTPGIDWTTTDADFPFDVLIGGCERATVTDISGSGTQSMSCLRNVNGLARAHSAGVEVSLWESPTLGL